jgi:hypothetical protein
MGMMITMPSASKRSTILSMLLMMQSSYGGDVVEQVFQSSWKIGFGSCLHQSMEAPALTAAATSRPNLFIWLGDNIYHDISKGGSVMSSSVYQ